MEGDAFEMEDQRNWTDASYKTYVRPLALPWGYTLAKGSRHEQTVRLSFAGRLEGDGKEKGTDVRITLGGNLATNMPDLGVALPAEEAQAALAAAAALRTLNPHLLVCNVDTRDGRGLAELEAYRKVGEAVSAGIVLEIIIPDERDAAASLAPVAEAVRRARLRLESVVVSSAADLKSWQPGATRPEKPTAEEILGAARAAFPGVKLGGGMLSTFTELNRKRPKGEPFDYVTHTTCSIVHAADDRSVMETLETLPAIIASTRAMIGDKAHRIGPSAIAARSNPYGKGLAGNPQNQRVCLTDRDPRQRGLFNAAWTLGYVAACALGGVEAVAIGTATGPLGSIYRRANNTQPYFDSIEGSPVYPAFHLIAGLARGRGRRLVEARVSRPGSAVALAWSDGDRTVLWLANLTSEPLRVQIEGLSDKAQRVSVIDAAGFEQAVRKSDALDALGRPLAGAELTLELLCRGAHRLGLRSTFQRPPGMLGGAKEGTMAAQGLKEFAGTKAPKFGHFIVEFATPGIGHILKSAGCDFVLFDLEHSGFGFETVKSAIRYFEAADLPVIVRAPSKEYHHIARAMDMGAEGLMLPMVGTAAEARHITNSMKYTPEGGRGVALQVSHDRYRPGTVKDKFLAANRRSTRLPDRDGGGRRECRRHRRASGRRLPVGWPFRSLGFARRAGGIQLEDLYRRDRQGLRRDRQAPEVAWAPRSDCAARRRTLRSGFRLRLLLRRRLGAARRPLGGDRQTARRLRSG